KAWTCRSLSIQTEYAQRTSSALPAAPWQALDAHEPVPRKAKVRFGAGSRSAAGGAARLSDEGQVRQMLAATRLATSTYTQVRRLMLPHILFVGLDRECVPQLYHPNNACFGCRCCGTTRSPSSVRANLLHPSRASPGWLAIFAPAPKRHSNPRPAD